MKTFDLTVLSCTDVLYKGRTSYCGVTTVSGSIGFEADHESFVGVLKQNSQISYKRDEDIQTIEAADGMLTFKDNTCSVIISSPE